MKQQLLALNTWYVSLQQRERLLVLATSTILVITLFYILAWEPVFMGLEQQQQKYDSQRNVLAWMLTASAEAKVLKTSGIRPANKSNQPVSLIVDQSATSAGLKKNMGKLESSGKDGTHVKLEAASFNQMLIWLNTLQQQHNISVTSASVELADKPGTVNARLSFTRS